MPLTSTSISTFPAPLWTLQARLEPRIACVIVEMMLFLPRRSISCRISAVVIAYCLPFSAVLSGMPHFDLKLRSMYRRSLLEVVDRLMSENPHWQSR